jgi:hypothetical protein
MYDEQLLARIRAYLRQNQGRYTYEALRRKLISEGVEPAAIDIATAEIGPQAAPVVAAPPYGAPIPQPPTRKAGLGRILLVATVVVVLNILGGVVGFYGMIEANNGYVFLAIAGLLFAAEVAGAIVYFRKNQNVSVGLMLAIVATPVVVFALLLGACLLLIAGGGRIGG